ncbi:hypothetical protein V6N13_051901 [Hibiscus sabdariffa]|uniref:Uncharacterized protein n=1 Tax=Hibiscus sabdariffa TaxID=183260 RepID=A0ABR2T535_9ROSI
MSSSPNCDIVGRWGEAVDDFSEDEENIMPVAEDDDIHLLDVDDVEAVMTDASEGNGLDVEDDVGARLLLGLGWVMIRRFGVMLDRRSSNRYPVIQLVNLQRACMMWTILQCEIRNMKLAYLIFHHLRTMGNWY